MRDRFNRSIAGIQHLRAKNVDALLEFVWTATDPDVLEDLLFRLANGHARTTYKDTCIHNPDGTCVEYAMAETLLSRTKEQVDVFSLRGSPCVLHLLFESGRCRMDSSALNCVWAHVNTKQDSSDGRIVYIHGPRRSQALTFFRWFWRNGGYECMLRADMAAPELMYYATRHNREVVRHLADASHEALCEIMVALQIHIPIEPLAKMVADYVSCFVTGIRPGAAKLFSP